MEDSKKEGSRLIQVEKVLLAHLKMKEDLLSKEKEQVHQILIN